MAGIHVKTGGESSTRISRRHGTNGTRYRRQRRTNGAGAGIVSLNESSTQDEPGTRNKRNF